MLRAESDAEPRRRWGTLGFFALLACLWFFNIGMRNLSEPDEGRYAEIPREMLASGDWIVPRLSGIPYLEKPPLQYWATAALYKQLGTEAWVSRLWACGMGFATLVLVYALGRRLHGVEAARAAVVLLASGPLFFGLGHINTLDMALTFLLTAALAAFVCAQLAAPGSRAERGFMALAAFALGLATLQKGIVALAIPALALVLCAIVERDRALWRRLHAGTGLAIVLALNAPWWLAMERRVPGFAEFFFVREHLVRFLTNEHGRAKPWWFFAVIVLGSVLPWIVPVARGIARAAARPLRSDAADARVERLLLIWPAAVFLFFAPSGSKLAPYILPMLPALALLGGRELVRDDGVGFRASLGIAFALAFALLSSAPLVHRFVPAGAQRDALGQLARWAWPAALVLLGGAAAAVVLRRREQGRARSVEALGLGVIASFALLLCGTDALERFSRGPSLAPAIRAALGPDEPLYCVGLYLQTLPFALGRTCIVAAYHGEFELQFDPEGQHHIRSLDAFADEWRRSSRGVAIVDRDYWSMLAAQDTPARVVAQEDYAVVIARR